MSENGFLLIADISGYTEFIKLHNLAKKPVFGAALAKNFESHASTIVADLLETVKIHLGSAPGHLRAAS